MWICLCGCFPPTKRNNQQLTENGAICYLNLFAKETAVFSNSIKKSANYADSCRLLVKICANLCHLWINYLQTAVLPSLKM